MEQKQAQNINQASEELTDAARQAFAMLADRTVSLQESNLRLTQDFFQNWIQTLQSQSQVVQEQSERQQQALQALTQESANAYSEFLNSALSFYQETLSSATQVAQNNMQAAKQAAEAAEAASHADQQEALARGWEPGRLVQDDGQASQTGREAKVVEHAGADRTAAIQLIHELLAEDPTYDKETWPEIAEALDRDRLSDRKLFVD